MIDKILWFMLGATLTSIMYLNEDLADMRSRLLRYKEIFK